MMRAMLTHHKRMTAVSVLGGALLCAAPAYASTALDSRLNSVMDSHDFRQLDLSESASRSGVRHALVNYLLGKGTDQYLDLDDGPHAHSDKRFKLRLKRYQEHHALIFLYDYRFR